MLVKCRYFAIKTLNFECSSVLLNEGIDVFVLRLWVNDVNC